ncbi:MAG: hypothetical protein NZ602_07230 [Thermoguttaceae bacterium]|nr:hypothetical protein [Thermoguttaceae bacterium]MDW8039181.1 hypothetical protein [Thermoguttaceae bacterium]
MGWALVLGLAISGDRLASQAAEGPRLPTWEKKDWNIAELVFVGQIKHVEADTMRPPIYPPVAPYTLKIEVLEVLRGDLKPGVLYEAGYTVRAKLTPEEEERIFGKKPKPQPTPQAPQKPSVQTPEAKPTADTAKKPPYIWEKPEFSLEKPSLIAAYRFRVKGQTDRLAIARLELANPTNLAEAKKACALPFGWRQQDGQVISPWAELGLKTWSGDTFGVQTCCSKTGRPALLAGDKITMKIEPVPPAKNLQWQNPQGDGEFTITISNPTQEPVTVPALLAKDNTILWGNSLVILWDNKGQIILCPTPDFQPDPGPVKPVTLQPGQSVSWVLNVFKIPGVQWRWGGDEYVFHICLGERCLIQGFYYFAPHHDPIRRRVQQSAN